VLKQVAKLFSAGFVRKDAEQLAKLIDALSAEQSRSWEFNGLRKGVSYPLRVRARIDEFGSWIWISLPRRRWRCQFVVQSTAI